MVSFPGRKINRCPIRRSRAQCELAITHATEHKSKGIIAEHPQEENSQVAAIHFEKSAELQHDVWHARGAHLDSLELLKTAADNFGKASLHYMKIGDHPSALEMFRNSSEMGEQYILLYISPKANKKQMYNLHIEAAETLANLAIAKKACKLPYDTSLAKIKLALGKAINYSKKPREHEIDELAAKQLELEKKVKMWND